MPNPSVRVERGLRAPQAAPARWFGMAEMQAGLKSHPCLMGLLALAVGRWADNGWLAPDGLAGEVLLFILTFAL